MTIAADPLTRPALHLAVQYACSSAELPSRSRIRRWVQAAQSRPATVAVRWVDADEGQTLNREFCHKDYATNVLTFVYHDADSDAVEGDIVVCEPVLRAEAAAQGKPFEHHAAHLLVHGMLHLQGFDHLDDDEAATMEALERAILARMRIPDPYADRDPQAAV